MTEQEKKLEKVKKSCATTKKVIDAVRMILLVGMIACIVGGILCIVFRDKIDHELSARVERGNVKFSVETLSMGGGLLNLDISTREITEEGNYALVSTIYCFCGAVILVVFSVIFGMLSKIFESIETSESPFAKELLQKLRRVFIIFTIVTVWFVSVGFAVILGLSFWCIYGIMDYGITLQTEVDETL